MTEEELREIEERAAKVAQRPGPRLENETPFMAAVREAREVTLFARNDVPRLVAEVRRLRAAYREVVAFAIGVSYSAAQGGYWYKQAEELGIEVIDDA